MDTMKKTNQMVLFAIFIAIEAVLAFTPIGFIMIPPVAITILHIPVIVCSVIMGWKYGAFLGAAFGLFSLIRASISGSPGDILFSPFLSGAPLGSVIMCFAPRILLGITPHFIYKMCGGRKNDTVSLALGAGLSTVLHSFLVLFLMYLFFRSFPLITVLETIVSLNCIVELLAAVIICTAVCKAVGKIRR